MRSQLRWFLCRGLPGCIPWTQVEARTERPIQASSGALSARVNWAGTRRGQFVVAVGVDGADDARVVRAELAQTEPPEEQCQGDSSLCTRPGGRASARIGSRVRGSGHIVLLEFPLDRARQALAGTPHLLVQAEAEAAQRVLDLDLRRAFRSGQFGLGCAIRYRPPGFLNAHFGHAVSGELGVDYWLGLTRFRLAYEIGIATCRGTRPDQIAACEDGDTLVPFGLGLNALYHTRLNGDVTLGVGLGYGVLAVLARDSAAMLDGVPQADPWLHGPRFTLSLARSPPVLPRFRLEPPKTAASVEFFFELVGRRAFSEPSLIAGLGYSLTAAY